MGSSHVPGGTHGAFCKLPCWVSVGSGGPVAASRTFHPCCCRGRRWVTVGKAGIGRTAGSPQGQRDGKPLPFASSGAKASREAARAGLCLAAALPLPGKRQSAFVVRTLSFRRRLVQGLPARASGPQPSAPWRARWAHRSGPAVRFALGRAGGRCPALVTPGPLQRESPGRPCAGSAGHRAGAEAWRPERLGREHTLGLRDPLPAGRWTDLGAGSLWFQP